MVKQLSPDVKAVITRFVYEVFNGTFAYPLLEDIDYRSVLFDEPSAAEQMIATFLNVLEINEGNRWSCPALTDRLVESIMPPR